VLFNPGTDRWSDHFKVENGQFFPLTTMGSVTIRLLRLNRLDRVEERKLLIEAGLFPAH
jgi:hypothetical protein